MSTRWRDSRAVQPGSIRDDLWALLGGEDGRRGQAAEPAERHQRGEDGCHIEGQSLPLDGIRPGRYYIVIWLNRERRLRESSYANDVGSTLVRITYADGLANAKAFASCFHAPPCR
jgi:hypothetical protein